MVLDSVQSNNIALHNMQNDTEVFNMMNNKP